MMEAFYSRSLFDLRRTMAAPLLSLHTYPWEILPALAEWICMAGDTLSPSLYDTPAPGIWIARDASVAPTAVLRAPCIIGHRTEVRHGALVRGGVLIGEACVVGNSCEVKNCILFDHAQVPHFNYVGDSILGVGAHLGAGAITSNVKSDRSPIVISYEGQTYPLPVRKCGAFLGDYAEIGCNAVLNPGTIVGRRARVYPLTGVRGFVPADSICKGAGIIVPLEER